MEVVAHEDGFYYGDGIKVPRVTHVLSMLSDYHKVDKDIMERAQRFGTSVHKMVELYEKGMLDESSLKPIYKNQTDLTPILDSWKKFKNDFDVKILETESVIYKPNGYAGTLDGVGMVKRNNVHKKTLIEIKTRPFSKLLDPLQTAAYVDAYNNSLPSNEKIVRRVVLHLKLDGNYGYKWITSNDDILYFRSLLAVWNWRNNNK
jgi:hypothetical protein